MTATQRGTRSARWAGRAAGARPGAVPTGPGPTTRPGRGAHRPPAWPTAGPSAERQQAGPSAQRQPAGPSAQRQQAGPSGQAREVVGLRTERPALAQPPAEGATLPARPGATAGPDPVGEQARPVPPVPAARPVAGVRDRRGRVASGPPDRGERRPGCPRRPPVAAGLAVAPSPARIAAAVRSTRPPAPTPAGRPGRRGGPRPGSRLPHSVEIRGHGWPVPSSQTRRAPLVTGGRSPPGSGPAAPHRPSTAFDAAWNTKVMRPTDTVIPDASTRGVPVSRRRQALRSASHTNEPLVDPRST